jgi:hypothetical protein
MSKESVEKLESMGFSVFASKRKAFVPEGRTEVNFKVRPVCLVISSGDVKKAGDLLPEYVDFAVDDDRCVALVEGTTRRATRLPNGRVKVNINAMADNLIGGLPRNVRVWSIGYGEMDVCDGFVVFRPTHVTYYLDGKLRADKYDKFKAVVAP